MAMAGLTSVASCDRHSLADRGTQDAVAPHADVPSDTFDREMPDAASQRVDAGLDYGDGATNVYGSSEVGDAPIPPSCFCVY